MTAELCWAQCGNEEWPGYLSARAEGPGPILDTTLAGCERGLSFGAAFFTLRQRHLAQKTMHRGEATTGFRLLSE